MMNFAIIMLLLPVICILILGLSVKGTEGRLRHCYVCRSRGELGDCKDPFEYNATSVEEIKGVEAAPCASGWCAKIIEGENDDFDTATERMCVQRPPTDGEERCSNTIIDRKPVYMCFCLGDLCNAGETQKQFSPLYFILIFCLVVILNQRHLLLQ